MTAQFITIEGVEGVGKSTAVKAIQSVLKEAGIEPVITREPGGSEYAEDIRRLLLKHTDEPVSPMTELLLVFASREQHIQQTIRPALANNQWVVCDRFTDASFAYQGGGRGIPHARIQALADWIQADVVPNITILLDAPVSVGLERMRQRGEMKDRIEQEQQAFFERVRKVYLAMAEAEPQRYRIIQADQPMEAVRQDVIAVIKGLLG